MHWLVKGLASDVAGRETLEGSRAGGWRSMPTIERPLPEGQRPTPRSREWTFSSSALESFVGTGKTARSLEKGAYNERRLLYYLPRTDIYQTWSTIPLFIISGNKPSITYSTFCPPSPCLPHPTLGRIENDSQNQTRRRSRSNHGLAATSPTACPMLARVLARTM